MGSYWLAEERERLPRVSLAARPDVEVVGGGVTGCACALALADAGLRVRLHERTEIAGGASGRNGGFALRGTAMRYDDARVLLGPDRARRLWLLTEQYVARLESLAGEAFRRTGSLRVAWDERERVDLVAEYEALRADGLAAEWRDDVSSRARPFFGAIFHATDGALQPARWVRRLARRASEAGAEIREASAVRSLAELEGDQVVIATDGYTGGLLPALDAAVRPTRGQVLVTEALPDSLFPLPHYARHGYDYWQQLPDGRLVAGGRRDVSLETEWTADEQTTERVQRELEHLVRELVGRRPRVTHRWAGIFGVTADLLPLVGAAPGRPGVWVACGYSGHGNVLGLACGEAVADAILGRTNSLLQLFDPARLLAREAGALALES